MRESNENILIWFSLERIYSLKQQQKKTNKKRNEVLFLSLAVSLVTSLSLCHSFMVKRELIVNNSIVGSLGLNMVSP